MTHPLDIIKEGEREFERYNFDPLIHTKDGKTWLEKEQVKSYITSLLIKLTEGEMESLERTLNSTKKHPMFEKRGNESALEMFQYNEGYNSALDSLLSDKKELLSNLKEILP